MCQEFSQLRKHDQTFFSVCVLHLLCVTYFLHWKRHWTIVVSCPGTLWLILYHFILSSLSRSCIWCKREIPLKHSAQFLYILSLEAWFVSVNIYFKWLFQCNYLYYRSSWTLNYIRFVAQNLFSISKDCIELDTPSSQLQSEPKKVKQKGVEKKHGLFTCWIENWCTICPRSGGEMLRQLWSFIFQVSVWPSLSSLFYRDSAGKGHGQQKEM